MTQHELIARIAYQLFELRGHTPGNALGDWTLAERIVSLCWAHAPRPADKPVRKPGPRRRGGTKQLAAPDVEREALGLLEAFVAAEGRASAASKLGYASTSSVGRILRGDRALSSELAERILQAFSGSAPAPALRILAGREAA